MQAVPFEPVPQTAAVILKQQSYILLITAFARSVLSEGATEFSLSILINWLAEQSADNLQDMLDNVVQDDDPAIADCFLKK